MTPARFAVAVKPFDLLIDAADCLDVSELVDRTGHGDVLSQRNAREGGEQTVELRPRRTVSLDASVGLFEGNTGGDGDRHVLGVFPAEIAGKCEQSLVVDGTGQLHFALDVDDPLLPHEDIGADANGVPERAR